MPRSTCLLNLVVLATVFAFVAESAAQNPAVDTRREYVRSSSPTKSGGRVINESVAGQQMVRIARAPGSTASRNSTSNNRTESTFSTDDSRESTAGKYDYPDRVESEQAGSEQVTAFRQAANLPPQLNFPPNNRLAQCNCNGVPVPPQQLQFPQQFPQGGFGAGFQTQPNVAFQAPTGFQQPTFGGGFAGAQTGYPLQAGIGVPQFNQTGGNWWTPFLTGSGYYTPLLNFRNMSPGTYLGQGLIGQPTAYVDGQPVRNLLRYISP